MNEHYQICKRCVMDNTSDDTITFDLEGNCSYCSNVLKIKTTTYFPNKEGEEKLQLLINQLKKEGQGKKYDCIMGLSGGLDSSYLLYLGVKWGLRILAVHVDDGFDTEISKRNIEKLKLATNVDLINEVPDKEQFNALTKAYLLAGVPNLAVPQDNVIFAYLYHYARKFKVRHFLSGGNFALESILQNGNTYRVFDIVNIRAINKQFGKKTMNKLQLLSDYRRFFDQKLLRIETHRPLNLIDYNRQNALNELAEFCGFEYYGSKHLENVLTKFIQVYWFYHKFKVDKRRSHFSSLIISNQMTREEAIKNIENPIYNNEEMKKELDFILNKLDVSKDEFEKVFNSPGHQHTEYKTDRFYSIFKRFF